MAEIVLVGAIIPKLITLIEGEIQLHRNMRVELLTIKDELENMRAFLIMAENSPEEGSLLDEVWVKQVREIAFESEDIVDEFMLHFKRDHLTSLASIFHSFKNLGPQRDFASRIKDIIPTFTHVRESNQRYRTDNPSLNSIALNASNRFYNPQQDALLKDEQLEGITEHKRRLIDMLMNSDLSTLKVVSVYGTGGVGKTSFVKEVYNDEEVKSKYMTRAWITVSQTFEPNELFKNLIGQVLQKDLMQPEFEELGNMKSLGLKQEVDKLLRNMGSIDLQQKAKEILQRNTYLVVLDDIWSIDAWNAIRNTFPDLYLSGSRVLITTRNENIALAASNGQRNYIFKLEPLSEDHQLCLFCKKTFNTDSCPEDLAEVTQSILKKCGGVPLAIVAISGVLVRKDRSAIEWEKVNRNLGTELVSTKRVLSLSYADLPYHLKPCYLYLSIFPEDHLIRKHMLIRLWIAEGFVKRTDTVTVEEVAESYLKELVQRSLIQHKEPRYYHIHDLLREIIYEKAKNQDFAIVARENNGLWPQEEWRVRRLSLHSKLQYIQNQNFHQLRSLLMFGVEESLSRSSMPTLFTGGCKLLTVLDLQGTNLTKFPSAVVKLFNLRYLSLRDTKVKKIPNGIGALQKLETLDLKRTLVSKLPVEIRKLQSLRNLLVYRYEYESYGIYINSRFGIKAPKGIGGLKSLQKLCFVEGGQGNECILGELQKLSTLRKLGIINLIYENCETLCASIDKMSNLHTLSIYSSNDEILNLQHITSPPKTIRRLYLTGQLNTLPHWIKSLTNVVRIFLRKSNLHKDPLKTLEELPNLVHMELLQVYNGDTLQFKAGKFQKLRILFIHEFEALERVIVEESSMPNLERFVFNECGLLKEIPLGINKLRKLKELRFANMSQELIATIQLHPKEGKDYKWISHIPDVTVVAYTVDGNWDIERLRTTHPHRNSHNT